ncbi:MAG: hypothetical protein JW818_08800 [Pirellulales bacterium]|nr:hypothetical protein [Pirellulales bacterium]
MVVERVNPKKQRHVVKRSIAVLALVAVFLQSAVCVAGVSKGNLAQGPLGPDDPPIAELSGPPEGNALPESIAKFGVPARRMILRPKHLFVSSGWMTVRPDVKEFGFSSLFSPPLLAYPAQVGITLDGRPIEVADYTWYPSEVELRGKPTVGLDVAGRVVPLAGVPAVVCELNLTNRSARPVSSMIGLTAEGTVGISRHWPFSPPRAKSENTKRVETPGRLILRSKDGHAELALAITGGQVKTTNGRLLVPVALNPGERKTYWVVAVLDASEKTSDALSKIIESPERFVADAQRNWQRRIERLAATAPVLETPSAALAAFYRRALLTFLTCRWDKDTLLFRPWYATSGIDGGAMCAYLWDLSYTSKMAILCDAPAVRRYLLAFAQADLTECNAINPLDGSPLGSMYSYNYYNLTRLAYDYVTLTGDLGILSEKIRGETFLDYLYRYTLRTEDLTRPPELIDYGTNRNLLELKRTDDYQHFTPSPNSERVLIYARLESLFNWSGRKTPHDLAERARLLRARLIDELWDARLGWFRCRNRQGQPRIAYSIQIFDLLRTGVLSPEQKKAVLSHLNEDEFLGPYGVHSLSKRDEGYDPGDADWGGPGAYAGDVPELIVDLIGAGFEQEGVDVLRRILWWGEFPYIPQAVLAGSRDYRDNGRANIIAGLSGGQAVLNGLLGIRVDGRQIHFRPVNHSIIAGLKLSNLSIRGQKFTLTVDAQAKTYTVESAGQVARRPVGQSLSLPLPSFASSSSVH